MNKAGLFVLYFLIHFLCTSQNVTIKGAAKTYENKEIGVWTRNDYISNTERQLTFSTIDSTGNFLLEFDGNEIQYVTIKIEKNIANPNPISFYNRGFAKYNLKDFFRYN